MTSQKIYESPFKPIVPPPCKEDRFDVQQVQEGLRVYLDRETKIPYPSITSVRSATMDRSFLDRWVARVGEEEAERIRKSTSGRGNHIHQKAEDFLKGESVSLEDCNILEKQVWKALYPHLMGIQHVCNVETTLWSEAMLVAGRMDAWVCLNDFPVVMDIKTTRKLKIRAYCDGYFKQATFYALAIAERYKGTPYEHLIPKHVAILNASGPECQWIIDPIDKWIGPLHDDIAKYYQILEDENSAPVDKN